MNTAVVQQPPIWMNLDASLVRAAEIIAEAAKGGAKLVVFPEAWLAGYPTFVWRLKPGADMGKTDDLFAAMHANAVNMTKQGLGTVQDAAKEHGVVVVMGMNEVDGSGSGSTIFNSVAIVDADGKLLNLHRKLMPTNPERMVWGFGDGTGLRVVDTAVGRVGALLCWENYMPLARAALYAQQIEIYCAPTWDSGPIWQASMQHIAREGGCWVVSCATAVENSDLPADLLHRETAFPVGEGWLNEGDAAVYKPFGGIVAGPMNKEKGLLWADIDASEAPAARRKFDATGHYARPDVLSLSVNRKPQHAVRFEGE